MTKPKLDPKLALAALLGGGWAAYRLLASRRSFSGQVVVVCGGSRGLGRALARAFAARGAHVAICARDAVDLADAQRELEEVAASARGGAGEIFADACDLRDRDAVSRFLARVATQLGPIDVLVANAATIDVGPVEVLGIHAFERAMDAIFWSSLNPVMSALPSMRARGSGTVVFITSIGGRIGVPHLAPYSAAKFAEVGFSESLRAEVARDGVRVLTVVPGLMRTGSYAHARFAGDPEKEYVWFTAGATTPFVAIDPDRAARRIVGAVARGDRELVFTVPAIVARRLHGWAPSLFARLSEIAGRLLPRAPSDPVLLPEEGARVEDTSGSKVIGALAARGRAQGVPQGQWVEGPPGVRVSTR